MTEYNKVVYDGQTLIDLTQDDVTASDVRNGVYFHSADGVRSQGTLVSTSVPTADTIAEWDSDVHMNSEDMTNQEVDDFVDSLTYSQIVAVDYIVEQGTSGIWTYRKWNSGIAECWGDYSYSSSTSTLWASPIYVSNGVSNISYPFTFTAVPLEIATVTASANACWLYQDSSGANTTTKTGSYNPIKVNGFSTNTFVIHFYVKGNWK